MTDRDLGIALGYAQPASAIANLVCGHEDEVVNHSTIILLTTVDGMKRSVRVWREQGIYILTMLSRQPKAAAFRKFAAETLYRVRREQPGYTQPTSQPEWGAALTQFANIAGVAIKNIKADQARLETKVEELATKIEQAPFASVTESVNATLQALQDLATRKVRLHDVVRSIVAQAGSLPGDDPDALYYRNWGNTWRTIHRHANPPVNAITGYTSLRQIENAIMGGEAVLVRLGGKVPVEQLVMEGVVVS